MAFFVQQSIMCMDGLSDISSFSSNISFNFLFSFIIFSRDKIYLIFSSGLNCLALAETTTETNSHLPLEFELSLIALCFILGVFLLMYFYLSFL